MDGQVNREDAAVTYRYVRVGLVALVVFLLVSLGLTWEHSCLQHSVSAFFYTRTHGVFIAALCAVGTCLIVYRGSSRGEQNRHTEDALLNFAGFLAFVVALIPTDGAEVCEPWLPTVKEPFDATANNMVALFVATAAGIALYRVVQHRRTGKTEPSAPAAMNLTGMDRMWKVVATAVLKVEPWLPKLLYGLIVVGGLALFCPAVRDHAHGVAAAAMFLAITLVAVYHACYAKGTQCQRRARIYGLIAGAMLTAVLLAIVLFSTGFSQGIFYVEVALIVLFGTFWGIQTWDVWTLEDRYPENAIPALADAATGRSS